MTATTMKQTVDPVDEVLPYGQMAAVGLQHVLVMYAGAIAVPVIVGCALRLPKDQIAFLINADLFACGVATLIQCIGFWRFGIRLPVVMGVTFAAVGPLVAMAASGIDITGIFGAVIVAGVFTVAVAPFASRLVHYFPPLVTGTIITVIGITLLRIGINWAGGGVGAKNFGDPINLGIVALVLATILVINKLFTGLVANIAVLLGLIIGFAAAMAVGMVDFAGVYDADWVALVYPFRFGTPRFDLGAIVSLCVVTIVASIPQPVLGGAGLVMFGMVAATGIKILARVDYGPRHNLLIIAISIAVGMIPLVAPTFFAQVPKWLAPLVNSGITLAAISA